VVGDRYRARRHSCVEAEKLAERALVLVRDVIEEQVDLGKLFREQRKNGLLVPQS
jgi:hypothetical protein